MEKLSRIFIVAVVALVLGGIAFLAAWDIPSPLAPVEKVIPNERFSR